MMKELGIINRYPRLAVAQAAAANPLYRAWTEGKKTVAPVKRSPRWPRPFRSAIRSASSRALRALEAMNGVVEQATEEELAEAAARADRTGMYACPHTAVALAVLEKLLARGVIDKKARTVVISTASGLKFTEFKVRLPRKSLPGLSSSQANPPMNLPATSTRSSKPIEKHHPRELARRGHVGGPTTLIGTPSSRAACSMARHVSRASVRRPRCDLERRTVRASSVSKLLALLSKPRAQLADLKGEVVAP